MATKTTVRLADDMSGAVLDDGAGETVTFGLDGKSYSIDLSHQNADSLRAALEPYVEHVHRVPASRGRANARKASGVGRSSSDLASIRQWARSRGYAVVGRGRISREILDAYDAA